MQVRFLALPSGLRTDIAMSCGLGHKCGSDPALLWLWWALLYAAGMALKKQKKKKKKKAVLGRWHTEGSKDIAFSLTFFFFFVCVLSF